MPNCPQCQIAVAETASRCQACGASLTKRFTRAENAAPMVTQTRVYVSTANIASNTGFFKVIMLGAFGSSLLAGAIWFMTASQTIDVDKGITVVLPNGWEKHNTSRVGEATLHAYRGEPKEKVLLNLLIHRQIPREFRNKERQTQALKDLIAAQFVTDQPLPTVVDLSQGEVIHVMGIADDTAIANTPSQDLDKGNFKHVQMGNIIRAGDFIHYELFYDEKNGAYQTVQESIAALAY